MNPGAQAEQQAIAGVPVEAIYDNAHSAGDGIRVVRYQRQAGELRVLDVVQHEGKPIGEVVADAQLHLLGRGFPDADASLLQLAVAVAPADAGLAGTLWCERVLAAAPGAGEGRPVSAGFTGALEEVLALRLQEIQGLAAYLPGGDAADSVVSEHTMTPEDAASQIRDLVAEALEALGVEP